jgi:hypothetical protein
VCFKKIILEGDIAGYKSSHFALADEAIIERTKVGQ